MFAIIWVIESGSSYRHIYFATPQCSFAHLRFPNDLDIVHDSLTKVKDQRNGKWQANLIILCCFSSKITWKIRQIRQSNSPFFTSLFSVRILKPEAPTAALLQDRWGELGRPGALQLSRPDWPESAGTLWLLLYVWQIENSQSLLM